MKRLPILILKVMPCTMLLLFSGSHVVVGLLGTSAECRAAEFLVKPDVENFAAGDFSNDGSTVLWSSVTLDGSTPSWSGLVQSRGGETWEIPVGSAIRMDGSGELVVGHFNDNTQRNKAALFSQNGDVQLLGQISGLHSSRARDISADGQTVVGGSWGDFGVPSSGFLWTDANGMRALPPTGGFDESSALRISADGRVAVGDSKTVLSFGPRVVESEATIWVYHGDGVIDTIGLGQPNGENTGAGHVSDDGSVVTGVVGNPLEAHPATSTDHPEEPFRWTETEGMVPLGLLSGTASNTPTGISGDGSFIVGNAELGSGRMFVWDEQHGMRDLETVLIEEHGLDSNIFPVADRGLLRVGALSSDGTAIGGRYGTFPFRVGWVAFLDRPLVVTTGVDGDFNGNAELDVADLDLLAAELQSDRHVNLFDVNSDNMVDFEDRRFWVEKLAQTFLGDANLDQEVNFADFLALSEGFGEEGGWAKGDFDGNGDVQFADFLLLSENFGNTAEAVAAVPEASASGLFALAALGIPCLRRRSR